MAETRGEIGCEGGARETRLRYLGFVHVAAIRILACALAVYELAKERSGPLRGGVVMAEGTVVGLAGPVLRKLRDVPLGLLAFVDRKVGHAVDKLDGHVPPMLREAIAMARAAPDTAHTLARDMQRFGVVETTTALARDALIRCEPKAMELYSMYEPVAERYAVSAWKRLNRLPLFPHLAQIMVPTAAYWAEKYNRMVSYGRDNGYAVAGYTPVVPVARIAKVFGPPESGEEMASDSSSDGSSLEEEAVMSSDG